MRNSHRALTVIAAVALSLGVASPAFASVSGSASAQLARTGVEITVWIVAAVVLVGLGALLFFLSRRGRKKAQADAAVTADADDALAGAAGDATAASSDAAAAVADVAPPAPAAPGATAPIPPAAADAADGFERPDDAAGDGSAPSVGDDIPRA